MKQCYKCKQLKDLSDFYTSGHKHFSYCKACMKILDHEKHIYFKYLCVKYKGGKCLNCGYNNNLAALEFHHKDPTQKDFNICKYAQTKLSNKIKIELDKCILLCANCHRTEHHPTINIHDLIIRWNRQSKPSKKVCMCGRYKSFQAKQCSKCYSKQRNYTTPDKDELLKLIWTIPSSHIAKKYNVSDTMVNKWCKKHNINKPPRGYWSMSLIGIEPIRAS